MTLPEAKNIIKNYFKNEWGSKTPVEYENETYKPVTGTPWVRFSVVEQSTENVEIGTIGSHIRKRHIGFVYAEVFRPAYKGDEFAEYSDDAGKILEFKVLEKTITLDASSVQTIGVISGGAWNVSVASIPFKFDEIIIN